MTLNQIIKRIKTISLAHKQVRAFHVGLIGEFLDKEDSKYPFIGVQSSTGSVSLSDKRAELNFRLFFMDLVHVSQDTKDNEQDVHSDMIIVALDILAQLSNHNYNDWRISIDNTLQLITEGEGDMYAGVYVDVAISVLYTQNTCIIPTVLPDYTPIGDRARVQLYEDLVTGELMFQLTGIPMADSPLSGNEIDLSDSFIIKAINSSARARVTAFEENGQFSLILTKL